MGHGLGSRLDPILAGPLGLVHRGVGGREELGGSRRSRCRGDAEARSHGDRRPVRRKDDPAGERDADALRDLRSAVEIGAREDEEELLAAPPTGEVDVAERLLQEDGELTEDGVAGGMAVAVVDVLEPVEVGDHNSKRSAEALDACELVGEGLLALASVGQARQAVDERLPLDDPVQSRVVERDHGMGCERDGGHPVLVPECVAEEHQRAKVERPSAERNFDPLGAPVRIPRFDDLTARPDEHAARRVRGLDGRLDDQPHQLVFIVRRTESRAETGVDVAQAPARGLEFVPARLQLEGHPVGRPSEGGQLVAALYWNALLQIAAGGRPSSIDETADRAHDRVALDIRDAGDEDERRDQSDQESLHRRPVGGVDTSLRANDAERRAGLFVERAGDECAVARAAQRDRAWLPGEQVQATLDTTRTGDDPSALCEDDVIVALQPGADLQPADESRVERHGGDDGTSRPARPDHGDLALRGRRVALADAEAARSLHAQARLAPKQTLERRAVALQQRSLEGRIPGEPGGGGICGDKLILVAGQRGPEARLQAGVHPPRLTPACDGRKTPERRREREERQQQKVGNELDFETTHGFPSSPPPPLPIHPLNELSTRQGTNMRETCARVLAAALMTGAIAFVLAMPALFESARDAGHGLTAPPSSLRRSVHAPALAAARPPARAARLAPSHSVRQPASRPAVATAAPGAVPAPRSRPRPAGAGRSAPARPEPETRELAATTPEPSAQPPAQASSSPSPTTTEATPGKGKGKAKGHDKDKRGDRADTASPEVRPTEEPPAPPPAAETHDDGGAPNDHGQGKGHAYGHDDG